MSGTSQRVRIDTHPDAKTLVDGRTFVGSSSIQLARGGHHVMSVHKSGFQSRSVALSPGMNGWVWGNLALGPLFPLGVIIDALTGAINSLTPTKVQVSLEPEPIQIPPPTPKVAPTPATETKPGPAPEWVLAVMEMERLRGEEPDDAMLRALSEQLRVRMAEARWRVVDRTAQESRWSEIVVAEKHRSYRSCHDPSCQIPLGRALAASHVLRTSIARFGQTCVLGAELYELLGEVAVAAGTAEVSCEEEDLLAGAHKLLKRLNSSPELQRSGAR